MIKKKYTIDFHNNDIIIPLDLIGYDINIIFNDKYKEWIDINIGLREIHIKVSKNDTKRLRRCSFCLSNLKLYITQLGNNLNSIKCKDKYISINYNEKKREVYFTVERDSDNFIIINDNEWIDYTVSKLLSNNLYKLQLYFQENNSKKIRNGSIYIKHTNYPNVKKEIKIEQNFKIDETIELIQCESNIILNKQTTMYDLEFKTFPNNDNKISVSINCNWINYTINNNHIIFYIQKNKSKQERKTEILLKNICYPIKNKIITIIQK